MLFKFVAPAALAAALFGSSAWAQIGSGWTAYTPGSHVQTRGCGTHSAAGGAETFGLTCTATSGDNRAEQRVENDYTSGTRQFEGEVRVVSLDGTNVSVKQTFMPDNGAFLMLGVATNGRLYSVGDSGGELATGIIGRWVRINTIHSVSAGTHEIYVDGVLKFTKTGGRQVAWHDKYGTYRLGSGHGPITAEWRNVKYWRDGTSGGGTRPPPAADASVPDARSATPDGPSQADAPGATGGAGGAGGGSGAGGTGGAGGAGGSGGSPGAGGSGGSDEGTPDASTPGRPRSGSGGCATGGRPVGGGLWVASLMLLGARLGRRRRNGWE